MKITGRIYCQKKGALQFLCRSICRAQDGESSLYCGLSREYMVGIFESGENIKTVHVGLMPKLEDVHKEFVKKFGEEPLTEKGIQRYRSVLGQLAWAALFRADLSFTISFLLRKFGYSEHCVHTGAILSFIYSLFGFWEFIVWSEGFRRCIFWYSYYGCFLEDWFWGT